jgi:Putative auto-transporter adhesin, head GIN domain
MKRIFLFFPLAILILVSLACQVAIPYVIYGSGTMDSEARDVSNFEAISLENMGDVYITVGDTEKLTVEAEDNLLPLLTSEVENGVLKLGVVRGRDIHPTKPITFDVTVKDLKNITLAGSGNIYSEPLQTDDMRVLLLGSGDIEVKGLSGKDLSITLTGSGNITIEQIALTSVDTSINGSGDIRLDGGADNQSIDVNGSGKYIAGGLETASANLSILGSSDVTLWVNEALDINVNGSGDVSYYGRPTLNQSGFGSGNVSALGEK